MNDLIEALKLLWPCLENPNTKWPTACEHDVMYICGVDMSKVDAALVRKLDVLGFFPGSEGDCVGDVEFERIDDETWNNMKDDIMNCFRSYRFGSC